MSLREIFEQTASEQEKVKQYDLYGVQVNVTPSEKEFVENLFNSLASIPTGRQALEDMKKYKVGFYLETALGSSGGYFSPSQNRIVMAKSLGMDFMESALVHEARHLLQNNSGRAEIEEQHLDYASRLMVNRATEADAQTQAIKACKEWEARGHDAPMKRFEKHYKPLVDCFEKTGNLSDAFKGWYHDEKICASYERGYDVEPAIFKLFYETDSRPFVSLKPEDIAHFCGAERVENFASFLNTPQARQVHLATKEIIDITNLVATSHGASRDTSLNNVPLRELKGNAAAQMYATKNIEETRKALSQCRPIDPRKKDILKSVSRAIDAIEKINAAEVKGTHDQNAEKTLKNEKKLILAQSKRLYQSATLKKILDNKRSR